MQRLLLLLLFGSLCFGCRQEANLQGTRRDGAATAKASREAPQDGSPMLRTENRTVIKKSGWELPISLPNERQYHATTVRIEGRGLIEVLNSPFFPQEKLVVKTPKFWEDGDIEYQISQIIEFTDIRKKPYCYQLFVTYDQPDLENARSGVPTFFSYRDDDGDGVFETLGEGCQVPNWVK